MRHCNQKVEDRRYKETQYYKETQNFKETQNLFLHHI